MRIFYLTLAVIFFASTELVWATGECSAALGHGANTDGRLVLPNEAFDQYILKIQSRKKDLSHQTTIVNGTSYALLKRLGKGTGTAYLAAAPDGVRVVIKHLQENAKTKGTKRVNSIFYEMAVTEYYLAHGVRIPKILKYEITQSNGILNGYLVKEYVDGLTLDHFEENRPAMMQLLGEVHFKALENDIRDQVSKIGKLHEGFEAWLDRNNINLFQWDFDHLKQLIKYGDAVNPFNRGNNWIFDRIHYRWVLIDP